MLQKINFKIVLYVFLLIFICRCQSVNLSIPGATIESSEALGRTWQKELGPSAEPARGVEFTTNGGQRPPNLDAPNELGNTHHVQHQARFGIAQRFEWGVAVGLDTVGDDASTSIMANGKFQFLGPSRLEAQAGDFSGAVFGRLGHAYANRSGDQATEFGPGGFDWKALASSWYSMLGVSFGYRVHSSWLVYVGGSYQHILSSIKIDQQPASDNSDPGGAFEKTRNGNSTALGLGSRVGIGKVFALNVKLMHYRFELAGLPKEDTLFAGGGFSFYF